MLSYIPLFPLAGFVATGAWHLFGRITGRKHESVLIPGLIATAAIGLSFLVASLLFVQLAGLDPEHRLIGQTLLSWVDIGKLHLSIDLRLDALSALFVLVITGVGTIIHVYSIGYMAHDTTPARFFAYLNLFCFSMLMLVLGSSLPVLFMGWEGVGLCSYLLIGYWYTDEAKAAAGKKAFVVNRIGDAGFLLGMFLLFAVFGTLEFAGIKDAVATTAGVSPATITAACLLLFVGCMGKSAQIPLYVWLPDAMAGPTPVSALIHAATMVTAGVYLVARTSFLYALSPTASEVMAIVGAGTAVLAATIAIAQRDIKKVLAYSTVSQLGYMFLACGVGAYGAGVFHMITHAFFKALLFLGAGAVIHALHEEQDILKMGGLRAKMPKTYLVFGAALLAICGVPPFSGFFSKDEILWSVFSSPTGSTGLWVLAAATSLLTTAYMVRLFSLVFLGQARGTQRPHETPGMMLVPLQILAVLSVAGGLIGIPHVSFLEHWLEPVLPPLATPAVAPAAEWLLMAGMTAAVIGVFALSLRFFSRLEAAEAFRVRLGRLHSILVNKWYVDEFYEAVFVRPVVMLSQFLFRFFDVAVIDRAVISLATSARTVGAGAKRAQTGALQVYALLLLIGLLAGGGYLIYGLV